MNCRKPLQAILGKTNSPREAFYLPRETPQLLGICEAEFVKFQALIYKIAGISLSDAKKSLLTGRLERRLRHHGLTSYGDYYRLVTSATGEGELQTMVDMLTTNETYFFREEKHFHFLSEQVLSPHPRGRSLDIWSAACSTGEEVYTLAMVVAEQLGLQAPWAITGSDISTQVLEAAARGLYPMDRARGMPKEYMCKYCLKGVRNNEGKFLIDKPLRQRVSFKHVNLNAPLSNMGRFDVIFLRNVMIYFDLKTKCQVVARLVQQLRPGGYFIVGHSESLNGINAELHLVQPTIYRKP